MTTRVDARDPAQWIPKELFAAFCGEGSEPLLAYYDRVSEKRNPATWSPNLLAILILPAWLTYRQQWKLWAIYTAIVGLVPFFEYGFGFSVPAGAFVGGSVALGFMANGLLLMTANDRYGKLRASGRDLEGIQGAHQDKAAKNLPGAFAGAIGAIAVCLVLELLANALLGG